MSDHKFRLGVLVSGRGTNLQALIDSIEREELTAEIAIVISDRENALALERCRKYAIHSIFLDRKSHKDKKDFEQVIVGHLQDRSVDLVCLAGFMRILGSTLFQPFAGRIINIHPSLLPAFPGLAAQKQALEHGVKVAGCTVHFVEEEIDSGPIIIQATVPVHDDDDVESLSERILKEEHRIYPEAVQAIIENRLVISGRKVIRGNNTRP
ncbi:MAG: phosphoribosylglycinamide formyltransferase [Nitrospinota bacterium]|nr:phosphoribosylglycinamide formyltransferase [Nitrospinota bacterium]